VFDEYLYFDEETPRMYEKQPRLYDKPIKFINFNQYQRKPKLLADG